MAKHRILNCRKGWCWSCVLLLSIILLLVSSSTSLATTLPANIPPSEYSALYDLFYATKGPEQWKQTGWNFTGPHNPCAEKWSGLTCIYSPDNITVQIETIVLNRCGLSGVLPDSIGNFSVLEKLVLVGDAVNFLYGLIPSTVGSLSSLISLDLSSNKLNSSLPLTIVNLFNLSTLKLRGNLLSGELPAEIRLMNKSLVTLDFAYNRFSGTLPRDIGSLAKLKTISLTSNKLTGTIPSTIGDLVSVHDIYFDDNELHGSLPYSLGQLSKMRRFSAEDNQLSGSIPKSFFNAESLVEINIGNNYLTGSIPMEISNLMFLTTIDFSSNYLSGIVSLSHMGVLSDIELQNNQFTGISEEVIWISPDFFWYFDISNNHLSGSLPQIIESTPNILVSDYHFYVSNNHMTGTIPNIFNNINQQKSSSSVWYVLDLSSNLVTGPLSDTLILTTYLDITSNLVSGTLPREIFEPNVITVEGLNFDKNLLSGSIPATIGNLLNAKVLMLSRNWLSGTIPSEISKLLKLEGLLINDNRIHGPITHIVNVDSIQLLRNVDVSNNQLTGPIPTKLVAMLTMFAAISNCFTDHVDVASICESATKLSFLMLDGLQSATSCRSRYFPSWTGIDTYRATQKTLFPEFPTCLLNMYNIVNLHLSGNAIAGTIPHDIRISDTLKVLSLSHNQLDGSIPKKMQSRPWQELDLSYNKLSGGISVNVKEYPSRNNNANNTAVRKGLIRDEATNDNIAPSSLLLSVNRLSGHIPSALRSAKSINILDGNLFACRATRTDLPKHDPYVAVFKCASNEFNYALYMWLAVIACCVAMVLAIVCTSNEQYKPHFMIKWQYNVINWLGPFGAKHIVINGSNDDSSIVSTHEFDLFAKHIRTLCIRMAAFVVLILMPVYIILGQFYSTYTEKYAWAVTAVFLHGTIPAAILFAVLLTVTGVMCYMNLNARYEFTKIKLTKYCSLLSYLSWLCSLTGNVAVMIGVNIAYIYITDNYGPVITRAAQILLSLFKLLWNSSVVAALVNIELLDRRRRTSHSQQSSTGNNQVENQHLETDQQVTSSSPGHVIGLCGIIVLFNTIVAPLFATAFVSANCFYNLINTPPAVTVNYSTAWCINQYSGGNVGDGECIQIPGRIWETSYSPPFVYSYQCSSTFITTYAPVFIFSFVLTTFMFPLLHYIIISIMKIDGIWPWLRGTLSFGLPSLLKKTAEGSMRNEKENHKELSMIQRFGSMFRFDGVFNQDLFIVHNINNLAILLTFGVVLPPVAVIGCVAIISHTLYTQLLIGRFIAVVKQRECEANNVITNETGDVLRQLECECAGTMEKFVSTVWIIGPFAAGFYAMLLFDMLGSDVGWKEALWMPIVIISLPFTVFLCHWCFLHAEWRCKLTSNKRYKTMSSDGKYIMREYESIRGGGGDEKNDDRDGCEQISDRDDEIVNSLLKSQQYVDVE